VAAPAARPVENPLSAGAANSHAVPAAANTTVLVMPKLIAGKAVLRRPIWSARRPNSKSATRFPST